nr:retrovirus-related Pol polyprotein from transposon 297 family [Tanacetum cinerariifolium]
MDPVTRAIGNSSNVNGESVDANTRRYVEEALARIRRSMDEMLNQIHGISLQNLTGAANKQQTQYSRLTKVEFPKFSGDDARGWIFKCERFFLIDTIPEDLKVRLLSVHLFDKALMWHRQFLKDKFDDLLSRVEISVEHSVSLYLAGLPTELEMGVRMFKPQNLSDAYCLTNLQEAILNVVKKKNKMKFKASSSRKQLSQKEYEEKRSKNLCFYCDKKYVPGHKCEGQLFTLVVLSDQEEQEVEFVDAYENLDEMETREELHILVDSVCTHHFLDTKMAKSDVFEGPYELPPKRNHDHRIPLILGTPPVNIGPYRHPLIQKDVIEAMVKELLKSWVIKPSQIPFAYPIVMVKKMDNTWRMCVDYRQLNKSTLKDKFPIPIIDELIDGQTEWVNRYLECYLRCVNVEKPKEWKKWLSLAKLWYNLNFHTSIQTTPFKAVYGQSTPIHIPYLGGLSRVDAVDKTLEELPSCNKEGLMEHEPIALLDRKMVKRNNVVVVYGLIQWANGSKDDATPLINLKLTGSENYNVWATAMKIFLQARNKMCFVDEFDILTKVTPCSCDAKTDLGHPNGTTTNTRKDLKKENILGTGSEAGGLYVFHIECKASEFK